MDSLHDTVQTEGVVAVINGHEAHRTTNVDPPSLADCAMRSGGVKGVVSLNVTNEEREALWAACYIDRRAKTITVPRRMLIHLLLDHAHLLCKLVVLRGSPS
jgi:hypothetical protein